MLILRNISYIHPNKELLFENLNLSLRRQEKIGLIGNNGAGKSTLLKIITAELQPAGGQLDVDPGFYAMPQLFGPYHQQTIAEVLGVADKFNALNEILKGNLTEENYALLNDDWSIEERCQHVLNYWQLDGLDLTQKMETLSGGQKTKVFLARIGIHKPELVLLDEPSNHLDISGRELLYKFIQDTSITLVVISHDRKLLNLLNTICELSKHGIRTYGGNYDFYVEQKQLERNALNQDLHSKEKALRKAKEKERETLEQQQRLDSRGKKKQEKSGLSRIMMNTLRNSAENSTSKMKGVHAEKIGGLVQDLQELRSALPDVDRMKFGFDNSTLHQGKILFTATGINFGYQNQLLWKAPLSFQITTGERIVLKGGNGSGKTTLINLILGKIAPTTGTIYRAEIKSVYIDQDYSLIAHQLNVYEQAQLFNAADLQEHEIKIRLNRFLFTKEDWNKPCTALSGGERMRLILCCLTISSQAPDLIVLDEPTNNLDIQNIKILTAAINEYQGTLIVVSHDEYFLEQINISKAITLNQIE
ncbi:ribosomal protection-like ABC-F family protein [Pedobacter gandavensis]|uniref:ribosomal protection-like ABC-F family protein n=1 Tax=Pedobacter gandavensis TaxID=2679963 RepID=UPI00292E4DB0|nr:ABC-F family ATP-binding cassette domain-containing protein [Pedobacter gandavensis]